MELSPLHERFLTEVVPRLRNDTRVAGVAAAGSIANGRPDEHSDVDLVLAIEDDAFPAVMTERMELLRSWAPVIAGFPGDHVGEPRVIIALVGPPLLHVDFKFVRLADVGQRIDNVRVLWERDGRLSRMLDATAPTPPRLDAQWIEDRFWVWVHYGATKLARGELFEVIGFLAYLREAVFGPLLQHRHGRMLQGVRRLESLDPTAADELRATVSGHDRTQAARALVAAVGLYRRWSADLPVARNREAESLAVAYLDDVIARG